MQAVGPSLRTTADNVALTSGNVQTFTASLAANADQIDELVANLGRLSQSANNVAERLPPLIDRTAQFVSELNVGAVNQTIDNVAAVTQAVRDQTDEIVAAIDSITSTASSFGSIGDAVRSSVPSVQSFLDRLGPLGETATSVAGRLDTTLADVQEITAAVDPAQVRSTISSVSGFTGALDAQSDRIGSVVNNADIALSTLGSALNGLNGTRTRIDEILAGISAADINRAVNNVSSATDNIAGAADSIRGVADNIAGRRNDINDVITNARETSANLSVASEQVQGLISSVNNLVNSPDGQGLTTEARLTLTSIRATAETIQSSIGPITDNIQSFSGQGLDELRGVIRDTGRAISRIERAILDLANNPSRVLFGGEGSGQVREFDGRVRR